MKRSILSFTLSLGFYFAFGQCGPYTVTVESYSCASTSMVLNVSNASSAQQIVWNLNGIIDTVDRKPFGITVAGGNGNGSATNQLPGAGEVFLDRSGNLYVGDDNYRIQKFPPGSTSASNGITVAGGNGSGSAANQFNPGGLFVDSSGSIYVADSYNNRIQKFPAGSSSATNGITVAGGNLQGAAANQLNEASSIFVDVSGNLYVSDYGNARIQKFPPGSSSSTNGITVAGGNGEGSDSNQLYEPGNIFMDGSGNIYVADVHNNRIQKFPSGSTSATNGVTVAGGNGYGNAANQLYLPEGIFVDSFGSLYVDDYYNHRIQKFPSGSTSTTNGITVAGGNGRGNAANQLNYPVGIYVDGSGNIYIGDSGNGRVQKWSQPAMLAIDTTIVDTTISWTSAGTYSTVIIDTSGCIASSDTIILSTHPGINAYFILEQSGTPHAWYIVNQCSGPSALTYVWNWGDSTTSIGDTTSHTYAVAGFYTVCVSVTDSLGCTATYCDSNVFLFKDQSGQMVTVEVLSHFPTGISEINGQSTIHLYPNPNRGSFTLETSVSIGSDYTIRDMLGNVIMQQSIRSDKQLIELPDAAEGVYTLVVKGASPLRFVVVK